MEESTVIEVVFLGTGGAFAKGRRGNLALLVEASGFRILIEAGPLIMQQLSRANVRAAEIEHLFISHAHGDHILGFPMLALNRIDAPTRLHVYSGHTTIRRLKALWELVYPGFDQRRLNLHWVALSEENRESTALTGGTKLHTALVRHPPGIPTLAARLDLANGLSIAFATDTTPNETTAELACGCDLLVHEASFSATLQPGYDPATYFHSTAQQAGEIARQAGCPRLALVHLSPAVSDQPDLLIEEARAGTDLQVIVPEDGERLQLPQGGNDGT